MLVTFSTRKKEKNTNAGTKNTQKEVNKTNRTTIFQNIVER